MNDQPWMVRLVGRRVIAVSVVVVAVALSGCASALNYGNLDQNDHRQLVDDVLGDDPLVIKTASTSDLDELAANLLQIQTDDRPSLSHTACDLDVVLLIDDPLAPGTTIDGPTAKICPRFNVHKIGGWGQAKLKDWQMVSAVEISNRAGQDSVSMLGLVKGWNYVFVRCPNTKKGTQCAVRILRPSFPTPGSSPSIRARDGNGDLLTVRLEKNELNQDQARWVYRSPAAACYSCTKHMWCTTDDP